jgi:hypothetical protein
MASKNTHGQQDAGIGTTKNYVVAGRIEEKASRGKFDMFGKKRPAPSGDMMDRIADEKLTGKYNVSRKNRCDQCWTYKSTNGACNC